MDDYVVWSNEHQCWWRSNQCGYTRHLDQAGRYEREEALKICRAARDGWAPGKVPPEVPVRLEDAEICERGLLTVVTE
jgi:hypothetical protein